MYILHSVRRFRQNGGVGTYLADVAAEQRRLGHTVDVLCMDSDAPDAIHTPSGVTPDVVHAHDYWRHKSRIDAPLVQSLHNYDFGCSSHNRTVDGELPCTRPHGVACAVMWPRCSDSPRLDRRVADFRQTTANLVRVKQAQETVAYSSFVAMTARSNGVERVHTLNPPVDNSIASIPYESAEPGTVVFVGRLSKAKGVEDLIRAIALLESARLRVVGDGYQRDSLTRLAEKLAHGRVTFLGWRQGPALAEEYARASVVAMPGRWPEPFGLVGLEAGAAGRPVVATYTGGVTDWLRDGVTGLGVPPNRPAALAAALRSFLEDPKLAASMGAAARRQADGWPDTRAHAIELDAIYSRAGASGVTAS